MLHYTGEHPRRSMISTKLQNLLHIFRTPFAKNTSEWLLLNFRHWCNHMSLAHPLSKILCNIAGCQRQYFVLRSYIRHIKQQHIAFWDTRWNIFKETTFSNDIHNNSSAEMIPAVDFDFSLQSILYKFSEETFDKLD